MADGVTITEGTQTIIASDDVGGTQYQFVKLDYGTNGASTPFTGTIPEISKVASGSVAVTAGTVVVNAFTADIPGGTIDAVSSITTLPDLPGGTVDSVSQVANLAAGTITSVQGGTLQVNVLSGTTVVNTLPDLPGGTVDVVTSVGALPDLPGGTIDAVTSVTNLAAGTVTRLEQGSVNVTAGTVVVTTLPDLPGGTIDAVTSITNLAAGTITRLAQGSINVTAGTVFGAAASGAADSGNPITVAGTDSGGTVYKMLVDSNGVLQVNGTVSTGGAGTQATRIIDGTVTSVQGGSMVVTAGTVFGGAASGAAASGNPVAVAGTDGGGTVYNLLVDSNGVLQINGTVSTGGAGTQATRIIDGTVTSVQGGSIAVTSIPNIPGGTVGVVSSVTALPDLPGGTIDAVTSITNLAAGTITRLAQGSINVTAGTVVVTTLPDLPGGTIDSITNIAGGTIQVNPRPSTNISTYGTALAGTATTAMVAAPGSGTAIYVNEFSITNQGTAAIEALVAVGTFETGANVLFRGYIGASGGGIQKSFPIPVKCTDATALNAKVYSTGTCNFNVSYWTQ